MECHPVDHSGLELLTSGDPSSSAFHSAVLGLQAWATAPATHTVSYKIAFTVLEQYVVRAEESFSMEWLSDAYTVTGKYSNVAGHGGSGL